MLEMNSEHCQSHKVLALAATKMFQGNERMIVSFSYILEMLGTSGEGCPHSVIL